MFQRTIAIALLITGISPTIILASSSSSSSSSRALQAGRRHALATSNGQNGVPALSMAPVSPRHRMLEEALGLVRVEDYGHAREALWAVIREPNAVWAVATAQYELGKLLVYGLGGAQDIEGGQELLQAAAKQNLAKVVRKSAQEELDKLAKINSVTATPVVVSRITPLSSPSSLEISAPSPLVAPWAPAGADEDYEACLSMPEMFRRPGKLPKEYKSPKEDKLLKSRFLQSGLTCLRGKNYSAAAQYFLRAITESTAPEVTAEAQVGLGTLITDGNCDAFDAEFGKGSLEAAASQTVNLSAQTRAKKQLAKLNKQDAPIQASSSSSSSSSSSRIHETSRDFARALACLKNRQVTMARENFDKILSCSTDESEIVMAQYHVGKLSVEGRGGTLDVERGTKLLKAAAKQTINNDIRRLAQEKLNEMNENSDEEESEFEPTLSSNSETSDEEDSEIEVLSTSKGSVQPTLTPPTNNKIQLTLINAIRAMNGGHYETAQTKLEAVIMQANNASDVALARYYLGLMLVEGRQGKKQSIVQDVATGRSLLEQAAAQSINIKARDLAAKKLAAMDALGQQKPDEIAPQQSSSILSPSARVEESLQGLTAFEKANEYIRLGDKYLYDQGVEINEAAAMAWFKKAASQVVNAEALYKGNLRLGELYRHGKRVPRNHKNLKKAFAYFHFAEKQEDAAFPLSPKFPLIEADASLNKGEMYLLGEGVDQDIEKARALFKKVANQSKNTEAQAAAQKHLNDMATEVMDVIAADTDFSFDQHDLTDDEEIDFLAPYDVDEDGQVIASRPSSVASSLVEMHRAAQAPVQPVGGKRPAENPVSPANPETTELVPAKKAKMDDVQQPAVPTQLVSPFSAAAPSKVADVINHGRTFLRAARASHEGANGQINQLLSTRVSPSQNANHGSHNATPGRFDFGRFNSTFNLGPRVVSEPNLRDLTSPQQGPMPASAMRPVSAPTTVQPMQPSSAAPSPVSVASPMNMTDEPPVASVSSPKPTQQPAVTTIVSVQPAGEDDWHAPRIKPVNIMDLPD